MKREITFAALLFICFTCFSADAAPVNLEDIANPESETFDGVVGVTVAPGLGNGGMWGATPAGLVLPSGLKFLSTEPSSMDDSDLWIGDFLFDPGIGSYGLLSNGEVFSEADLRNGTSLAGAGGTLTKLFQFTFEFPTPVRRFGVFASAARGFDFDGTLSLTSIDTTGNVLETVSVLTNSVPFDDDNFVGLTAAVPIGAFQISSKQHFAFDEVIWEPIPEPSVFLLVVLGGLGVRVARTRSISSLCP